MIPQIKLEAQLSTDAVPVHAKLSQIVRRHRSGCCGRRGSHGLGPEPQAGLTRSRRGLSDSDSHYYSSLLVTSSFGVAAAAAAATARFKPANELPRAGVSPGRQATGSPAPPGPGLDLNGPVPARTSGFPCNADSWGHSVVCRFHS
jgi:hypothetical protein